MTNCKDCEYFELISTGVLDEPYILICNCLEEPPIYQKSQKNTSTSIGGG